MEYENLECAVDANLKPHLERIKEMDAEELIRLRNAVKETRRQKFRFAHELTGGIEPVRIQLALARLAALYRAADKRINSC